MAKESSKASKADYKSRPGGSGWTVDDIPEALRDAGKRAAELAQNPYARSLLAAGLVAAAAAFASNKRVRDTAQGNLRKATEAGAEHAGAVGIAIVNAATEAVQRMMNMAGAEAPKATASETSAPANEAKAAAPATRKPTAKKALKKTAPNVAKVPVAPKLAKKPVAAKSARKPAQKKTV